MADKIEWPEEQNWSDDWELEGDEDDMLSQWESAFDDDGWEDEDDFWEARDSLGQDPEDDNEIDEVD